MSSSSCRSCMRIIKPGQGRSLFGYDPESRAIIQLYALLTSRKATENDGLPFSLCNTCWRRFRDFGYFRDVCIASDRKYRSQIAKSCPAAVVEQNVVATATVEIEPAKENNAVSSVTLLPSPAEDDNHVEEEAAEHLATNFEALIDNAADYLFDVDTLMNDDEAPADDKADNSTAPEPSDGELPAPAQRQPKPRSQLFSCHICGQIFGRKSYIAEHLLTHGSSHPFACTVCEEAFASKLLLDTHLTRQHSTFGCDQADCTKSFSTQLLLDKHISFAHSGQYMCDKCGRSFRALIHLNHHRTSKHQDPATWRFQCELCKKRFPLQATLTDHLKRHMNIRKYSCVKCKASFVTAREQRQHLAAHNAEKMEQCPHCERRYQRKQTLVNHIQRHHDPIKPFACDECGQPFARKWILREHKTKKHGVATQSRRLNENNAAWIELDEDAAIE